MAFSIEERQTLGIHGLLPAAVKTQEEQLELCRLNLDRYTDDLSKYIYLTSLLVRIHTYIIISKIIKQIESINLFKIYRTEMKSYFIVFSVKM